MYVINLLESIMYFVDLWASNLSLPLKMKVDTSTLTCARKRVRVPSDRSVNHSQGAIGGRLAVSLRQVAAASSEVLALEVSYTPVMSVEMDNSDVIIIPEG